MRVWAGVEMANRRGCGGLHFFNADSKGSGSRIRRRSGGFDCAEYRQIRGWRVMRANGRYVNRQ